MLIAASFYSIVFSITVNQFFSIFFLRGASYFTETS